MSKRQLSNEVASSSGGDAPLAKRFATCVEPVKLQVHGLDELDAKLLKIQVRKLADRLLDRRALEDNLRKQLEEREQRLRQNEELLYVINRYWNQFDEDIQTLLQKLDETEVDQDQIKKDLPQLASFLSRLTSMENGELEAHFSQRVAVSIHKLTRLLSVFETHRLQRNILANAAAANTSTSNGETAADSASIYAAECARMAKENGRLNELNLKLHEAARTASLKRKELEDKAEMREDELEECRRKMEELDYVVNEKNAMRFEKLERLLVEAQTNNRELKEQLDVARGLAAQAQTNAANSSTPNGERTGLGAAPFANDASVQQKLTEVLFDLEEQREQATSRLSELETLQLRLEDTTRRLVGCQQQLAELPESVVCETLEYRSLKAQFSVVYTENNQLHAVVDELRGQLVSSRNAYVKQLEELHSESQRTHTKLAEDTQALEAALVRARNEMDAFRADYETRRVSSEQTAPVTAELRKMVTTVKEQYTRTKTENQRLRKRLHDADAEIARLRGLKLLIPHPPAAAPTSSSHPAAHNASASNSSQNSISSAQRDSTSGDADIKVKIEPNSLNSDGAPIDGNRKSSCSPVSAATVDGSSTANSTNQPQANTLEQLVTRTTDSFIERLDRLLGEQRNALLEALREATQARAGQTNSASADSAQSSKNNAGATELADVRKRLKQKEEENKELKMLLDVCKSATKDGRDRVELLANERRLKNEYDEVVKDRDSLRAELDEAHAHLDSRATERQRSLADAIFERRLKSEISQVHRDVLKQAGLNSAVKRAIATQTDVQAHCQKTSSNSNAGDVTSKHESINKDADKGKKVLAVGADTKASESCSSRTGGDNAVATNASGQSASNTAAAGAGAGAAPANAVGSAREQELMRRLRRAEDTIQSLQVKLQNARTQETALLTEMEVTAQAYEEMQAQNARLLDTAREKDDANLRLIADRFERERLDRNAQLEKAELEERVRAGEMLLRTRDEQLRSAEEKERALQGRLVALEKEAVLRLQAADQYRRKAIESVQLAHDLKMHLDKYQTQLRETQLASQDKSTQLEREIFKFKRLQDETTALKKRIERIKRLEQATNADEVLLAEIAEYKEQLTCSCCKTRRKDGILTKCHHVFCYECLKTRYEMRQRKCPKCNAAFGANDYARIFLT